MHLFWLLICDVVLNLASEPTSGQADLTDSIDPANGSLELWQVLGARISRCDDGRPLDNGRQTARADIEFAKVIIGEFDRVSWITVSGSHDASSLFRPVESQMSVSSGAVRRISIDDLPE